MSRQFGFLKAFRYHEKIARVIRPAIWKQFKFRGHEILWDPKKEVSRVRTVSRDTVRRIVRELGFDPAAAHHIEISPDRIICWSLVKDENGRAVCSERNRELLELREMVGIVGD